MPAQDSSQKPKEKILRNTTQADIEKIRQKESVKAKTESEVKTQQTPGAEPVEKQQSSSSVMKTRITAFDPPVYPIRLPSGNFFIDKEVAKDGIIYVRRMVATEENMWYSLVGKNIDMQTVDGVINRVMDSCIQSNISAFDLSLIDKLPVLFKIFQLTYGNLKIKLKCNTELHQEEYPVMFDFEKDLKYTFVPKNCEYPFKIKLTSFPNAKIDWYIRYPTIGQQMKFYDADLVGVRRMLTERFEGIVTENGEERPIIEQDYEGIVTNLNNKDQLKYQEWLRDFGNYGAGATYEKVVCQEKSCVNYNKLQTMDLKDIVIELFKNIILLQNK